jgi:hypothetical protein
MMPFRAGADPGARPIEAALSSWPKPPPWPGSDLEPGSPVLRDALDADAMVGAATIGSTICPGLPPPDPAARPWLYRRPARHLNLLCCVANTFICRIFSRAG